MNTKNINAMGRKDLMADYPEIYHNLGNIYPKLSEFFHEFNPDLFPYDGYSPDSVADMINFYLTKTYGIDTDHIKAVISEFDKLIAEDWDEEYLYNIILGVGANISIDTDGWKPTSHTYKEWIIDLRDILQKEYDRRMNS